MSDIDYESLPGIKRNKLSWIFDAAKEILWKVFGMFGLSKVTSDTDHHLKKKKLIICYIVLTVMIPDLV